MTEEVVVEVKVKTETSRVVAVTSVEVRERCLLQRGINSPHKRRVTFSAGLVPAHRRKPRSNRNVAVGTISHAL
jgi:hypothetical protein